MFGLTSPQNRKSMFLYPIFFNLSRLYVWIAPCEVMDAIFWSFILHCMAMIHVKFFFFGFFTLFFVFDDIRKKIIYFISFLDFTSIPNG